MNRALQKTIFARCRELGLDGDARRDLQLLVCGKASMSDMTDDEMKAVVDRLKQRGFQITTNAKRKHPRAPLPGLRLIHVLWKALGDAGQLKRADRAGLNAFVRSQFGAAWQSVPADIDMLRDPQQIEAVIRALKEWIKRSGVPFDWDRIK